MKADEFETAEWLTVPLFVQQTVVPAGTVIVPPWKAYSTMLIMVSPGWQGTAARASGVLAAAGTKAKSPKSARTSGLRISHRCTACGAIWIAAGNVRPDP